MGRLQDIIPQVLIPHVPDLRPSPFTPPSAPYAPFTTPPRRHVPYWIIHDPNLADLMMERLRVYLTTAPGGNLPPSLRLQQYLDYLPEDLLTTFSGALSTEETTNELWARCLWPRIRYAVRDVDQNDTLAVGLLKSWTLYSESPDALISPTSGTSPRLHYEAKGWSVFNALAPQILELAQHVEGGQVGTHLELRINEEDARSVIFKIGISMINRDNPMPYGILFGGHQFMLFSLFRNESALGEVYYGLACSGVIDCTDITRPLIPLVIYCLLGNPNGPAQLFSPSFPLPPIPTRVTQDEKPVTQGKYTKSMKALPNKINIHTSAADGAQSRSFSLCREPIRQDAEDFASNASPAVEILLSECIGHGVAGQVFVGTTDNEVYALKVAPWKSGGEMLQREADIYRVLLDLQGRCIPKVFGFFSSEYLKVLIMEYSGSTVQDVSDLSMDQRSHQLLEELCLIHERGVVHGDLRAENIVLQNGSPHPIDFSHGSEHQCTGRTMCSELIEARQFLLLSPEPRQR